MNFADRFGRTLFVAAAVGLAWGIRGDYGHVIGAMYPGAILGLAWLAVAGSPALLSRMPVIAALTAAGIGAGGTISYGILHGYAQSDTLVNYSYGLGALFLQGGCWGTFGCALAGLLIEKKPLRTGDWIGLLGSIFIGGWVMNALVADYFEFQVNPPRSNSLIAFVGAALGQFAWLLRSGYSRGLRGAFFGFIGFGLGMAIGRVLANAAVHLEPSGYTMNHWNVMELTCGFIGGGVFTFGMLGLGPIEATEEPNEYDSARVLGALYVLAVIPMWHRFTRVTDKVQGWAVTLRDLSYPDPEGMSQSIVRELNLVCLVACVGAILWMIALSRRTWWPSWLPTIWLSGCMLVFQNLTSLYYWRTHKPDYLNTQNGFWALFLFMLLYQILFRPGSRIFRVQETPVRYTRWVLATLAMLGLLVAVASITNGDRTMRSANTRWPLWTWSSGKPFPGR